MLNETKVHPIEANNVMLKLYMDTRIKNHSALENFKKQIEIKKSGFHHKPYESNFRKTFVYRSIFIALGALFFFFTLYMYEQSISWLPYSYIFSSHETAKNVVLVVCSLFSVSAFGMCFAISAEKEALEQFIVRSRKKLVRSFKKQSLHLVGNELELKRLESLYAEGLDKIADIKDNSRALLKLIAKSEDQEKIASLYNEALLEANDQLHLIINKFRKSLVLKS